MIKIRTFYRDLPLEQKVVILFKPKTESLLVLDYQHIAVYYSDKKGELQLKSYENCYGGFDYLTQ